MMEPGSAAFSAFSMAVITDYKLIEQRLNKHVE